MLSQLIYKLKRPFHFFKTGLREGLVAELRYRFPARKLTIITITGTDGKTTSSTMLYSVLKAAGYKVALLSTVAAYIGDEEIDTGFHVTAPQPNDLHKFMRQMVDQGYTHLVLEATSHGIYQYRTWGIKPSIAGLTNINFEHLDYHLNYREYVKAKALLLKQAKTTVINADDQSYAQLKKILPTKKTIIYSKSATLPRTISQAIRQRFSEAYNQMNARLVYLISQELGVKNQDYIAGIQAFAGIPGRMQEISSKKQFRLIVDFAHTPQGLDAALKALRKQLTQKPAGRLIAIFGCAGLRDRKKRPAMGRIGAELADLAIFTAEDPRTEDIWSIIRQMKENLGTFHSKVISLPDRGQALEFAINKLAKRGDIIVILGKGHEQSMCYGHTETLWHDATAIKKILAGETVRSTPH